MAESYSTSTWLSLTPPLYGESLAPPLYGLEPHSTSTWPSLTPPSQGRVSLTFAAPLDSMITLPSLTIIRSCRKFT
ncbi:hypothetical protein FH972_008362 [Carpinus fangiana]|uniref:Uncharacterized protein n=1 Tax=Carpinus fangiana TaxID=176857 RepID=A0A5N6R0T0_9ROSI|nr:hypothetical protein FH972_008362 [Carpinus fangiana]